ncbi:MAG: GNAT family N-acetyltransferase [Bacillota bacterium]
MQLLRVEPYRPGLEGPLLDLSGRSVWRNPAIQPLTRARLEEVRQGLRPEHVFALTLCGLPVGLLHLDTGGVARDGLIKLESMHAALPVGRAPALARLLDAIREVARDMGAVGAFGHWAERCRADLVWLARAGFRVTRTSLHMAMVLGRRPQVDLPRGMAVSVCRDSQDELDWLAVIGTAFPDGESPPRSREELRKLASEAGHLPDGMLLLREAGVPVGAVQLAASRDQLGGRHAYVWGLGVVAAHRRRGYGRLLLELVAYRAYQAGFRFLELSAYADNVPALALYESAGLRALGKVFRLDSDLK